MSIGILPNQVPKTGERYNLTLTRLGEYKGALTARFYIDTGQYRGKSIASFVDDDFVNLVAEQLYELDKENEEYGLTNPIFYAAVNRVARRMRFSGKIVVHREAAPNGELITVDEEYQESNVKITYSISNFGEPTNDESDTKKTFESAE